MPSTAAVMRGAAIAISQGLRTSRLRTVRFPSSGPGAEVAGKDFGASVGVWGEFELSFWRAGFFRGLDTADLRLLTGTLRYWPHDGLQAAVPDRVHVGAGANRDS